MSNTIVTIASNAVTAKLVDADRDVKLLVSSVLSYQVDGFDQTSKFKSGGWDGRSSFFDFRKATFPAGFSYLVSAHLMKHGYQVRRLRNPLPEPLGPEKPVVDSFGDDPRYDYQPETIRRLTKHGQIIARVATGGGKSRIARMAYKRIQRPTLFITTRGVLMHQMKDSFIDMGERVGVLGDSEWTPNPTGFNVGMVQTLQARVEDITIESELQKYLVKEHEDYIASVRKGKPVVKKTANQLLKLIKPKVDAQQKRRQETIEMLAKFELVIIEEAHEVSGNGFFEVMRQCKSAYYRLALTATPFMKGSEESNMRLMACSGSIAIEISEKLLIDRGILAKPYFKYISQPERPKKLFKTTGWKDAYVYGITQNEFRNRAICFEATRAVSYGLSTIILVQHKDHGKLLLEMLKAMGVRVAYIAGEHKQQERQNVLNKLAKNEIDVVIGSTILDVGVDMPAVGMGILAGGGKAEVSLRQRVGRVLRAKKLFANVAFVVDFDDEHNNHTRNHAQQRKSIIMATEGFAENVLNPGEDFVFEDFGFKKAA